MDKMHLTVHFGSGEVFVACFRLFLLLPHAPRLLCIPLLSVPCPPFALFFRPASSFLLRTPFPRCSSAPHDKKRVLFCGFAEANFFATWGNARFSFLPAPKSTEKYPVFIVGQPIRHRRRPATRTVLPPFAPLRRSDRFPLLPPLPPACGSCVASLGVIVVACCAAFRRPCRIAATTN